MAIVPFTLPDELVDTGYEKILAQMLAKVPDRYDKPEGGFVWDMLAPPALEASELLELWLSFALKMMSHIWATGRWLDYHAHDCGLERRGATYAYGNVVVKTTQAVTFPAGFIFSVPSENSVPAIEFETLEEISADADEILTIRIKAVESGINSNVKADTITIMKTPIKGVDISTITNPEPVTGGTAAESDDSLRARIDDYYAGRMASFVGNRADYERWAKMVDGVGYAHCIPTYDGANTVKIIVADANGDPANNEILRAVEKFIFGTGHDDINRLAPIGIVKYEVSAPTLHVIDYSLNVKIAEDTTLAKVEENIRDALKNFYTTLADETNAFATLKYVEVSAVILKVAGVEDFKHLRINDKLENVEFTVDEFPVTGEISLTLF